MYKVRTARSARSASRRKASLSPAVRYFRSPSAVCSPMPACRGAGALELLAVPVALRRTTPLRALFLAIPGGVSSESPWGAVGDLRAELGRAFTGARWARIGQGRGVDSRVRS